MSGLKVFVKAYSDYAVGGDTKINLIEVDLAAPATFIMS